MRFMSSFSFVGCRSTERFLSSGRAKRKQNGIIESRARREPGAGSKPKPRVHDETARAGIAGRSVGCSALEPRFEMERGRVDESRFHAGACVACDLPLGVD